MVFASRGGDRGRGGRGGGFRGGGRGGYDRGPPQNVVPIATYSKTVEGLMCCNILEKKVPLLMRTIYMENKTAIGKVDDVFGPVSAPGIAIKPNEGVKGESFKEGDKVYADPFEIRDVTFFMPKPTVPKNKNPLNQQGFKPPRVARGGFGDRGGRGGGRGFGDRGGRGGGRGFGDRGGRGGGRGGDRGRGAPRGRY